MKKIIAWMGKNKGAIISTILGIVSVSDVAFNWILGSKTVYVMGFNLLGIIGTLASVITAVCTTGFHTTDVQNALDKAKALFLKDKNNGLTYQDRVSIGKKINEFEKKKESLKKENATYIENVEVFEIASSEDIAKYNAYKNAITELDNKIAKLKTKLGEATEE